MTGKLRLGILDQSPVRKGRASYDALQETLALAVAAESFGYSRYWLAEHHSAVYTCPAPEVLICQVAGRTKMMRVGSGGVLLRNYSALKVAETFLLLEAFYPGRIDLGLGRTVGGMPLVGEALAAPRAVTPFEAYPDQLKDLCGFLTDDLPPDHRFAALKAMPGRPPAAGIPEPWLLGSGGPGSPELAAELGLPFSVALFFAFRDCLPAIEDYRRLFRPSKFLREPRVNLAVSVVCAPTEAEARRLALSRDLQLLPRAKQHFLPSAEEAQAFPFEQSDDAYFAKMRQWYFDGTPQQVADKLSGLAERYGVSEFIVHTICYDPEDRLRSYRLLAEALL